LAPKGQKLSSLGFRLSLSTNRSGTFPTCLFWQSKELKNRKVVGLSVFNLISLAKVTSLQFLEKLSAWSKNIIPDINSFSLIVNYYNSFLSSNKNIPFCWYGANKSPIAIGLYLIHKRKMTILITTTTFFSLKSNIYSITFARSKRKRSQGVSLRT